MATRNHSNITPVGYGSENPVFRWTGLLTTDVGDWITVPAYCDYTVYCTGVPGAAVVVIMEGTNEVGAPVAPARLHDTRGFAAANDLTFVTADAFSATVGVIKQGLEVPVQMRPNVTGGDGTTNVTIIVRCARRQG